MIYLRKMIREHLEATIGESDIEEAVARALESEDYSDIIEEAVLNKLVDYYDDITEIAKSVIEGIIS